MKKVYKSRQNVSGLGLALGQPRAQRLKTVGVGHFTDSPLGNWLKNRREVLRWTQAEVAHKMGVSQVQICKIEQGQVWNLTYVDVIRLARAVEGTVAEVHEALEQTYRQRVLGNGILSETDVSFKEQVTPPTAEAKVIVTSEGKVFTTPGEIPESGIPIDVSTLPMTPDEDE